jgi:Insertion element 4 transposase N-terminal
VGLFVESAGTVADHERGCGGAAGSGVVGVLVSAVPRDAVDAAVAMFGVGAKRSDRKLPTHVTAYLTMAMCPFTEDNYGEVATKVAFPDISRCEQRFMV